MVYQNLNAPVGAGAELTAANFISNPDGWSGGKVDMDLNPLTNILTLKSNDTWDFQTFDAYINNITFSLPSAISGISLISNGLTNPLLTPSLSFTNDSIHISYDYRPNVYDFTGGEAKFQLDVADSNPVPEPGTMMMLGLGLTGLAIYGKRRANKSKA